MAASKSKKKPAPERKPADAVALLKQDHEKVRGLLSQFENATGARREKLRGQIEQELKIHTTIEEEIFYPAYREASRKKDDKKLFFEAVEEHHVVDLVLPEMNDGADTEELKAKAKVLKDLVEHHADEEEKEMFPRARKLMSREELRALGEQLMMRKQELGG
ncbi:MAG TPA: hemerythrin domain-containing protein [Thermoanaerobaculia bacterium]|nr:hemerythrin domain-containing protein [Thermoanaerobaculia bacterium]